MILGKETGWNLITPTYWRLYEGLIWFILDLCDDEANRLLIRAGFGIILKGHNQVKMTILLKTCVLWGFSSDCVYM